MSSRDPASGSSKTLVKALSILDAITQYPGGLSLADISRHTGLAKPTAHRVLGVLANNRLLRADTDGNYRLSTQCLVLGTAFIESLDLRQESRDLLAELVNYSGETCHLGVLDGQRIVYIEKVESSHAVRMHSRVGSTNPVHSTGLGKAMLAHCDEESIDEVIAAGLPPRTERTITDANQLREELAVIRRRGFAIDDIENEDGIRCVAAPVLDHTREVVAGVSISGPTYRVTRDRFEKLGHKVRESSLTLSHRIGYPGELPIEEPPAKERREQG